MNIEKISVGEDAPNYVNVIIEVPMNSDPVKYEMDKESGAIFVDRFIATPMYYPCNYGFIPHTLSQDGDPADVLVISDYPVIPNAVIAVKPIGVLIMEDEKGMDEKILVIPNEDENSEVNEMNDLPSYIGEDLEWFFTNYKKHESEKWSKVEGFIDSEKAIELFEKSMVRFLDHGELPV